jgi:hypothetical protein
MSCYWQKGLELFLIGLLTNLPHGDVIMKGKNSLLPKQAEILGLLFKQLYTTKKVH